MCNCRSRVHDGLILSWSAFLCFCLPVLADTEQLPDVFPLEPLDFILMWDFSLKCSCVWQSIQNIRQFCVIYVRVHIKTAACIAKVPGSDITEYQDGSKPGVARLVTALDPYSIGFASELDWKIGTIFKEGDLFLTEQHGYLIVLIKKRARSH